MKNYLLNSFYVILYGAFEVSCVGPLSVLYDMSCLGFTCGCNTSPIHPWSPQQQIVGSIDIQHFKVYSKINSPYGQYKLFLINGIYFCSIRSSNTDNIRWYPFSTDILFLQNTQRKNICARAFINQYSSNIGEVTLYNNMKALVMFGVFHRQFII